MERNPHWAVWILAMMVGCVGTGVFAQENPVFVWGGVPDYRSDPGSSMTVTSQAAFSSDVNLTSYHLAKIRAWPMTWPC